LTVYNNLEISLAGNGFKLFLSKAESFLEAPVNVLIEIAEVRWPFEVMLPMLTLPSFRLSDNNETMMVLMRQLSDRIKATSEALRKASSAMR
jgi:hypothetical protein